MLKARYLKKFEISLPTLKSGIFSLRFIPHSITETENPIRYTKNIELIKTDITITPGLSQANEEQIEYKTEKTLKTPIIANLL